MHAAIGISDPIFITNKDGLGQENSEFKQLVYLKRDRFGQAIHAQDKPNE